MNMVPGGGFAAAVAFGALVIWFHAWNQFKQPSYRNSSEFNRVLGRLRPSDMRRDSVFIQAYVFYAVILTFIYLLICLYASVPFLRGLIFIDIPGLELGGAAGAQKLPESVATGADFDSSVLGAVDGAGGPSPTLPLLVSLAVVGLAPNVAFLARIEEWIRGWSHRLSGIPTHLIDSGFKLRRARIFDPKRGDGLLISDEEWAQARVYFDAARLYASRERETLHEQVLKIIALRNWVLRGRLFQPDGDIRFRYEQLEAELRKEIRDLLARLDELCPLTPSGSGDPASSTPTQATQEAAAERTLEWAGVVREIEEVCGDTCVLVALYSERDAFAADMKEVKLDPASAPEAMTQEAARNGDAYDAERREAAQAFLSALQHVSLVADRDSFGTMIFFRLAGSIVLTHTVTGLFLGRERLEGSTSSGSLSLAFVYALTAAIMYALPLFFALGYQQEQLKHDRWENIISGKRSRALAQYVFTFGLATAIALFGLIGYNIYTAMAAVGLEPVADRFKEVLAAAYAVEAARALMGGTLAIFMALTIDAWRADRLMGWDARWPWGLVAATTLSLAALGAWERYRGLDAIEGVPIAYDKLPIAALSAALVGLVASVFALQSLMDEFVKPQQTQAQNQTQTQS